VFAVFFFLPFLFMLAGFLLLDVLFSLAGRQVGEAVNERASQHQCQNDAYDDPLLFHFSPPEVSKLISAPTAASSLASAVWRL